MGTSPAVIHGEQNRHFRPKMWSYPNPNQKVFVPTPIQTITTVKTSVLNQRDVKLHCLYYNTCVLCEKWPTVNGVYVLAFLNLLTFFFSFKISLCLVWSKQFWHKKKKKNPTQALVQTFPPDLFFAASTHHPSSPWLRSFSAWPRWSYSYQQTIFSLNGLQSATLRGWVVREVYLTN